jgi:RHS repeat-associated protein
MTLGNDEYSFVYDPTASIPAVVAEVGPYGTVEYYREPDGSLVARIMDAFSEDGVQFYHFDALGNTVLLTRPGHQGGTLVIYEYGAWGEAYEAIWSYNPYQYVGQLGYYTHYQDSTLGMLQLGVRFYEPGTGRFGQRDVMWQPSETAFAYAASNPVLYVDPSGEFPLCWCLGLAAANFVGSIIIDRGTGRPIDWCAAACSGICGCLQGIVCANALNLAAKTLAKILAQVGFQNAVKGNIGRLEGMMVPLGIAGCQVGCRNACKWVKDRAAN